MRLAALPLHDRRLRQALTGADRLLQDDSRPGVGPEIRLQGAEGLVQVGGVPAMEADDVVAVASGVR
jgi:hypothetical protein